MNNRTDILDMIDGYLLGVVVARNFGLDSSFFSRMAKRVPKSLNGDMDIRSYSGITLVLIPLAVKQLIKDGYIGVDVSDGDESGCDHIFRITSDTVIGFWK